MNRLAALLLCLCGSAAAVAGPSSVELRAPAVKLLETAPGRIVTASVVVANRGRSDGNFSERLELPSGCQQVAPPNLPFRLGAGAEVVRVLAVLVPANMPAGRCEWLYRVQSQSDPSSVASTRFTMQVTAVDKLDLVVDPRTDLVLAGDVYHITLHATNHGNSRLSVQVAARNSQGFALMMTPAAFLLEAGATRDLNCTVTTEKSFAHHIRHAVTFDAAATSISGKSLTASQASVVEIVPRVSGTTDPFHRLPMQLRTVAVTENGRAPQVQAELSGEGSLDEAGKRSVDFLFRGPDLRNTSLFGERDEYGASYHDEYWDLDLGDRVYTLSPLTEKHSLGRGAGVTWHNGRTAAGGFYMNSRFRQQGSDEFGAFIRHDFAPSFTLQGNFLRKRGTDSVSPGALPQNLFTLESHYRHGKLLDLTLESGVSLRGTGGHDYAYRAEARGEFPGKINYTLEHVHSGPNFQGYYSDAETTFASIGKAITPRLRVQASLNKYADNLALNDVRSSVVNRECSWHAGADYDLTKKTVLTLEWQHVQRADILHPAAYDFTSDAVRIGASHDFGKLRLQGFLDLGTLENRLTRENGPFQRYGISAIWRPTPRQAYTLFGSYGPNAYSGSSEISLSAGVSAHWQVSDHLEANVSYARNQFDSLTGGQNDQVFASVSHRFANRSSLSFIGRWSHAVTKTIGASATNEAAVMLSYAVPFDIPISRRRSIGSLEGQLVQTAKGRETGVGRVVLQAGEQFAVTDEEGRFQFPGLKPGACDLRVVMDSLDRHLAIATPLPMKVKIRPAETSRVRLLASPACSVAVRVTRYDFASASAVAASSELRATAGEEAVAVELSNGRDVWRAQTDRAGHAAFDRLPAGNYHLRTAAADLPPLHTIDTPERRLTLKPGETETVAIRILPQRRTLRLMDQGSIR